MDALNKPVSWLGEGYGGIGTGISMESHTHAYTTYKYAYIDQTDNIHVHTCTPPISHRLTLELRQCL